MGDALELKVKKTMIKNDMANAFRGIA